MPIYRNILIVRTDRMGDLVLTTPAIRALRKAIPSARISILVAEELRTLVEGNPDIDEVLTDDRLRANRGLLGFWKLVFALRKRCFDLAIVFHTKKRTNMLCFFAGIPQRLGYQNEKYGFLLNWGLKDYRTKGLQHEAQNCLDVLRALGIESQELVPVIPVRPESEIWAENFLREQKLERGQPIVAVQPGASCPTRRWPPKFFSEVVNVMREKYGCQFVIIGDADSKDMAQQIISQVSAPVWDFTGKTTLPNLVSLFKRCRMLVSSDSGPVHVAAAVGIGVVSIFTRNQPGINPERWQPLGGKSRVIAPPVDMSIDFAKGEVKDTSFLEVIKPEEVLRVIDEVYKLC